MTDPQHKGGWTPGPWISERSVDEYGLSVIASDDAEFISNPSRGQVCHISVVAGASGDKPDLAQANARLIAAAPELYESLEKALDALQRLHTDVEALIADSEGVYGLHHNGDPAPWSELIEGGAHEDWIGTPLWSARNAWRDGQTILAKASPDKSGGA